MSKTVAFSRDSVNVFFHILTRCNLRCRHCYINPQEHGQGMLPLSTIRSWLNAFAGRRQEANLIFLGGEPTLHPELSDAVRTARDLGYASVTIDTNGYLFGGILRKVSPGEVDFFSFSLDGPDRETNDRIRGEGCFEACTSGIRNAVSAGFGVSVIYTVSRMNLPELHRMGPLLAALGVERFFIQVIGLRGRSRGEGAALQVTPEQWLGEVPAVAERIADLGISVTFPRVYLQPEEVFECAGRVAENYFIFPNGRVYRCPLCEDFPLHSLELRDNRLVEREKINEADLFRLTIPEGCVMNRLVQPENLPYGEDEKPVFRIACCMLKEEITPP